MQKRITIRYVRHEITKGKKRQAFHIFNVIEELQRLWDEGQLLFNNCLEDVIYETKILFLQKKKNLLGLRTISVEGMPKYSYAYPKTIGAKSEDHRICILHHLIRITFNSSKLLYPVFNNLEMGNRKTARVRKIKYRPI